MLYFFAQILNATALKKYINVSLLFSEKNKRTGIKIFLSLLIYQAFSFLK